MTEFLERVPEWIPEWIAARVAERLRAHGADPFEYAIAELSIHDVSNPAYADERFAEWLARAAASRHRSSATRRDPEGSQRRLNGRAAVITLEHRADQFAVAMSLRVTAARMAKKYPRYALCQRSANIPGTFAQTAELAARERCAPRVDLRVAAGVGRELWDEACDAWVELPASVPRGRYVALTVAGDSMTPLLSDGDVILVNPRAKVTRDSVIVARRPEDGYVVKHVARVGRTELELASLNPAYPPFTIARDPALIVGAVVARLTPAMASPRMLPERTTEWHTEVTR